MPSSGVTADVDMKDVELNEVDVEKQPMNTSPPLAGSPGSLGEKNGVVKVKVAEEDEDGEMISKFTGLSKEELLQVAGTPGWVRTRWLLLILFWLGWLGMLAGAIVIIVQAPHCKELPTQNWWQKGGLYRIQAVEDFQDSDKDDVGDLEGEDPKWQQGAGIWVPLGFHPLRRSWSLLILTRCPLLGERHVPGHANTQTAPLLGLMSPESSVPPPSEDKKGVEKPHCGYGHPGGNRSA